MTEPMTDARLDEIERRWRAVGLTSWAAFCDEQEYPNTNIVAFKHRTQLICSIPGADKRDSVPVFIESAIEDVPALVAEVRRLREENAKIRAALGGYPDSNLASLAETLRARNETLEAEVARLTRERDEAREEIARLRGVVDKLSTSAREYEERAEARVTTLEGVLAELANIVDRAATNRSADDIDRFTAHTARDILVNRGVTRG